MISNLILIAAVILLTVYLIYIVKNYGVQKSISFTDYIGKYKNAFEVTLYYCGVALALAGVLGTIWSLSVAGLLIIGVAIYSDFERSKLFNIMHMTCAFGGFGFLAFTPLIAVGAWWLTLGTAIATVAAYKLAKTNKLWWTEITVILASFIGLFLM